VLRTTRTASAPEATAFAVDREAESISSKLFSSFADLPSDWLRLCGRADLAMDREALGVFQRTLADQCRCWAVIVYHRELPIGCAALCLFATELAEVSNPWLARMRDRIRAFWPSFLRLNVLFCGLPIPSGASHIRFRAGADPQEIIAATAEVDRIMRGLARTNGARLLVFKELEDTQDPLPEALRQAGYIRGDIPPMHHLHRSFKSFAHYREALRSRYRAQIQRSQKKLETAGFETLRGRGQAFFDTHWSDETHQLYVAVQQRAEHKLELMPSSFFPEMARTLGNDVSLTLIRREQRVCAFTFAITREGTHYNLYSGLDYALNNEGDLYFNLFYHDLDQAFRSGATSIHLGQTSDSFKSRLGSSAQPLCFFVRGSSAWMTTLLRRVSSVAFPASPNVRSQDVFARSTECGRPVAAVADPYAPG
jgi:hypothetical protein